MRNELDSLPEPGPALDAVLTLVPAHVNEVRILREDERGLRLEWHGGARPLRFDLDPLGAKVYRRIDGVQTLARLAESFALEHGLRFLESAALWIAYVRTLCARNLLTIGPSPPPGGDRFQVEGWLGFR